MEVAGDVPSPARPDPEVVPSPSEVDRLRQDREALATMLSRREDFYRCVLESLSEGVLITNAESRIIYVNRRLTDLTGWSAEELIGKISYEVLAPAEAWPAMRRRLEQRLEGREEVYENELVTKSGERHWVFVRAAPYRDAEGRILGTIGAIGCIQRQKELERENVRLRDALAVEREFPDIVGSGPALRTVLEQIRMVAPTEASVLILGESGTGKELVARAIHEASARRTGPLVRVNCASIPKELFESEFFGHVRGAFTGAVKDRAGRFEIADGGTLFLDEVGEIPADLQSKLLRVLQEGTFERVGDEKTRRVNVRIVAATNRELLAEARAGRFRLDLYYRLAVFPMELPPLRERRGDLPELAAHFLQQGARRLGRRVPRLPPEELARLANYDWPGNVRELQNVIERALILAGTAPVVRFDGLLAPASSPNQRVPAQIRQSDPPITITAGENPETVEPGALGALKDRERALITAALAASGGRVYGRGGAAERLGVPPTTLLSKARRLGIR